MLTFKQFINEEYNNSQNNVLMNFLHHLSSSTIANDHDPSLKKSLDEARSIEDIKQDGVNNQPSGNLFHHIKNGFHAAFPEGESPEQTTAKAKEAQKHFRNWMTERGGHAENNQMSLTGDNGKTRLSTGVGMATIGVSLAPHSSSGLHKFDVCPKASSECRKGCLGFTAGGNKQYPETAFRAKLLRTQYVAEHPENAARLMSHELKQHEDWTSNHKTVHDHQGNIIGYQHKQTGEVTSELPVKAKDAAGKKAERAANVQRIKDGIASKEYKTNDIASGFRGNVTSDLPLERLMPSKFFERHKNTQFYDYTKVAGRLNKKLPENYSLALSHTGTGHAESNDKEVIKHLENGGVVAMVHQKSKVTPTHVEDVQTGRRWKIVDGDSDDNVFDRHRSAGIDKSEGVVSGLKLKGIKNEAAGHFANKVDDDGVIRINHPK